MSSADKAVSDLLVALGASTEKEKSAADKREELRRKLSEKKAAREKEAAPVPTTTSTTPSSGISDSVSRVAALEAENDRKRAEAAALSDSRSSENAAKLEALKAKKAELERKKSEVAVKLLSPSSSAESSLTIALKAEKEALVKKAAALPTLEELKAEKDDASKRLDKIQRGIDLCFLMDCTGSMGSFIAAAKEKILEIIKEHLAIEERAIMRIAFVGYRDYGDGALQYEKVDFVEKESLDVIRNRLAECPATGGGDGPEDIVGGFKIVTELSWNSSTRLMIHPKGLIPEDLLKEIIKKRIDYYFMKITNYTDKMIGIFQEVFKEAGKEIYINPIAANAVDFVPKVVKSISSSMARSAAFKDRSVFKI